MNTVTVRITHVGLSTEVESAPIRKLSDVVDTRPALSAVLWSTYVLKIERISAYIS